LQTLQSDNFSIQSTLSVPQGALQTLQSDNLHYFGVPCQFHKVHCKHCKVTNLHYFGVPCQFHKVHCKHCKVTNLHFRVPLSVQQGALQTLQSNNFHSNSGINRLRRSYWLGVW
jgi:hypothetical protein